MLKLHVVPVQGEPFDHPLSEDSLVVGRASGSDLVLEDRFLSRRHSRIFRRDGQLMIEDLGSRNGTVVNGRQVAEPTPLGPGDVIRISGSVLTVLDARDPDPGAAGAGSGPEPGSQAFTDHTILRSASGLLSESASGGREIGGGEEEVRRYAARLKMLNDVHRALGRSIELDELLEMILERAFDHLRPEQGAVFLKRGDELDLAATRSLPGLEGGFVTSTSLQHEVTEKGMAALVLDAASDERFADAQSILFSGIRSLVAAPLLDGEETLGMIALSSRAGVRQFSEEDMELLVSLASVAALCLRNVTLAAEAAERRRMQEELALGRRIQKALLPDRLPEVEGYELFGRNVPSRGVSGDYYVVRERGLEAGRPECVLMVADVSGKGIAASILTASLEALAAGPIEDGLDPDEICRRLSRLLHRRTPPEKYATAFLAVVAPATGRLRYANAGHNPALLVRAGGEVETLEATGMPLGLVETAAYRAGETELGCGDTLILYTDGITEAEDPGDEEYGLERLVELCRERRGEKLGEIARRLVESLDGFVRGRPFADDRTLVMARRR